MEGEAQNRSGMSEKKRWRWQKKKIDIFGVMPQVTEGVEASKILRFLIDEIICAESLHIEHDSVHKCKSHTIQEIGG